MASTSPRRWVAIALVALAILATLVVLESRGSRHLVRAVFVAALQVRPGQQVRVAGRTVGSVQSVALSDGAALVTLGIDGSQWPLHAGTTATLRFGSAGAYASRYVQLMPGSARAPALAQDALLPESDTVTPVEFDQIYSTFGPATRRNLGTIITRGAQTLSGHGGDISRDLSLGAPATQRIAGLMSDLGLDPPALGTLVTAGASTASALRDTGPRLEGLVSNAAQTFAVLADNAAALSATIKRLPTTLAGAQRTLSHLDRSLGPLGTLVADIAPGAAALVRTAPLLTSTLQTLERVGPLAQSALATGIQQLPVLGRFLDAARPFVPGVAQALAKLAPMVGCIRPYGPEIGGWLETWQGGAIDYIGHYGRVNVLQTPVPPGTTQDSAQAIADSYGTLKYAYPRPPGLNAGQPWFQPQCGAGPSALNPADDPEAGK